MRRWRFREAKALVTAKRWVVEGMAMWDGFGVRILLMFGDVGAWSLAYLPRYEPSHAQAETRKNRSLFMKSDLKRWKNGAGAVVENEDCWLADTISSSSRVCCA